MQNLLFSLGPGVAWSGLVVVKQRLKVVVAAAAAVAVVYDNVHILFE